MGSWGVTLQGLGNLRELHFPRWPYQAPGEQHCKQDAGPEPVPAHFHFPDVILMIRRLNQAQRVCSAFSHQWESWLRNGFMILMSHFPWHNSTYSCLCTGYSHVLPGPTKDLIQEESCVLRADALPWTLMVAEVDAVPCSLVATQV